MAKRKAAGIRPEASGQSFENLLDFTNRQYANGGTALVHKRPTPVKVLRTKGPHITKAAWAEKSTVDYDGVYKGKSLYFEAKNTMSGTSFPLVNIEAHQIEHMKKAETHGALCFVLISFMKKNKVFYVPFSFVQQCLRRAAEGGRKSIEYNEFEEYCFEVNGTRRAILDYLVHVDAQLENETA